MSSSNVRDSSKKYKIWTVLLYPDDPSGKAAFDLIKTRYSGQYVAILHDRDVDDEGKLKKPHWHIAFVFENQRYRAPLAKDLGIEERLIQPGDDAFIDYWLHRNDLKKFQYEETDLIGDSALVSASLAQMEKRRAKDTVREEDVISRIFDFIDSHPTEIISRRAIADFCLNNYIWSFYRRSGSIIMGIVAEHNEEVTSRFERERLRELMAVEANASDVVKSADFVALADAVERLQKKYR